MPKQRNHPHHHRHSDRSERNEPLALPEMSPIPLPGRPRILYPKGWLRPRSNPYSLILVVPVVLLLLFILLMVLSHL